MKIVSIRKTLLALACLFLTAGLASAQGAREATGALLAKLPRRGVQAVAFSPDGKFLAAGYGFSDDGGITVWNAADHAVVVTLPVGRWRKADIKRVEFSNDGKLLAAASDRGDVLLWTVGSWSTHKTLLRNRGKATDLSISPDGTKLAYASEKEAVLYDIRAGTMIVIATLGGLDKEFNGISFSHDGRFVILCGSSSIQAWDIERRRMTGEMKPASFGFFGRMTPDGKHIIAGGGAVYGKKTVQVWDFPEGRKSNELTGFRSGLFALAASHSGTLFALGGGTYGGDGGSLSLWNLEGAREIGFVSYGDSPIEGLAFSPDDSILAAASSGVVLLYSVNRIRGPEVKKQDFALCGELLTEGGKTYIAPLSKVPMPMRPDFELQWMLEIANADSVAGVAAGSPVVLRDWSIESSATHDEARIVDYRPLLYTTRPAAINSGEIIFGDIRNPGWNEGFLAKIYGDGSFVASNNSGKCLAYGHLDQLKTDFESVKKLLINEGLLSIPKEPLTLGADHYRTRFIELKVDGVPELRSDADSIEVLLAGGPAKKREAFSRIFDKEEPFINSLLRAGFKLPPN